MYQFSLSVFFLLTFVYLNEACQAGGGGGWNPPVDGISDSSSDDDDDDDTKGDNKQSSSGSQNQNKVFFNNAMDDLMKYTLDTNFDIQPASEGEILSVFGYGNCSKKSQFTQLAHVVIKEGLKHKSITRGWLDITRIPKCIILKSTLLEEDVLKATMFNFQICPARITFLHTQRAFRYYYYEWYIPNDFDFYGHWEIFLFGEAGSDWLYP